MRGRTRAKIAAMAIGMVFQAAKVGAEEGSYLFVSSFAAEGRRMVRREIKRALPASQGTVAWKELPHTILIPLSSASPRNDAEASGIVQVAMEELSEPMALSVTGSPPEGMEGVGEKILRMPFALRGRGDGGGTAVSLVELEGEGELLVDGGDRRPIAGKLRLVRSLHPSPWFSPTDGAERREVLELAWGELP